MQFLIGEQLLQFLHVEHVLVVRLGAVVLDRLVVQRHQLVHRPCAVGVKNLLVLVNLREDTVNCDVSGLLAADFALK